MYCLYKIRIQPTLDISNTDVAKYPLISLSILLYQLIQFGQFEILSCLTFTFQLMMSQTTDISKEIFWDQKIYFDISVVWDDL